MQRNVAFLALALSAGCAQGATDPVAHPYVHDVARPSGFRPNPAFVPQRTGVGRIRSGLRLEGEVLVLEGDDRFVSSGGGGSYGISSDNQILIVNEVLAQYPDELDTIQIYTTFLDEAHVGTAYYSTINNTVSGLGIETFNSRPAWGLPEEGRLSGFSNMNTMAQWGELSSLNAITGYYHGVIAHELSHRWILFMLFKDGAGMSNNALLGRDEAHWSALAQAYGSVSDGNLWRDNGDGSFTNLGSDRGFAPLDRYAMGQIPASEVEDFYYLSEASLDGDLLDKTSPIPFQATVRGRRIDVKMSQVEAEMGPRNPPAGNEDPYYRVGFVLVTRPGEPASAYQDQLELLKAVQRDFPETWKNWANGAMCTRISARCPEPKISLAGFRARDGGDDRIGPGERFELTLSVQNTGLGTAEGVSVVLEPIENAMLSPDPIVAPAVPEGGQVELGNSFAVTAAADAPCGTVMKLRAVFSTREGPSFSDTLQIPIGTFQSRFDAMDEAPDWKINPDGDDDASRGGWQLGAPDFVSVLGVVLQPNADHTPGESKLAFHTDPHAADFFANGDLSGGKTTLQSPLFALADTRNPELVLYAWHVAKNLVAVPPTHVAGSELIVQVSNDGGANWHELGRFDDDTREWTRLSFPLRPVVVPSNRMTFRFSIADDSPNALVEAGIDDLEIVDYLDSCPLEGEPAPDAGSMPPPGGEEESGCGCRATRTGTSLAWALLLGLGLGLRARRRH